MRERPASPSASTVLVSSGGEFWGASSDGSKILFTKGGDLFEYDVDAEATRDLTPGGSVLGVLGLSEDASDVYFVAETMLASNENSHGDKPEAGRPNLYVDGRGETRFIATLSPEDDALPIVGVSTEGDWSASLNSRTAEVSTDGRSVEFMSRRSLTGYDNQGGCNERGGGAVGCAEVFVYDSDSRQLSCASCNPSGEPPVSAVGLVGDASFLVGGAFLPTPISGGGVLTDHQLRTISTDGGRVFFDTAEPLVSTDTNGAPDVYEWERSGSGTCLEPRGCIYLISAAASDEEAIFLDASANGDDIFFTTRGQLVPQDKNEQVDLYDARVNGGFTQTSTECTGAGCQGAPPAPPIFATPASVTFHGAGNFLVAQPAKAKSLRAAQKLKNALRQCKKELRGKRASCETHARQHYLTTAQKLKAALKQCRKAPGRKRASCEARAKKRYKSQAAARHATSRASWRKAQ